MSSYGSSTASPSPYVGANSPGGVSTQQQQMYQTSGDAAGYQGQRSGGIIGHMVNQHLGSGKPILNKLGKSISSRLGNMPFSSSSSSSGGGGAGASTQQGHQGHYGQANQGQAYQQSTGVIASPQPQQQQQQQQWSQAQHPSPPPPPSPYQHAHASPYQPSGYFAAAPSLSGQPSYSPQQTQQTPVSQSYTPPLPGGYAPQHGHEQGQTYGQHGYGKVGQNSYQAPAQPLHGSYAGQEIGVVAGLQNANTPPPMAAQSPQPTWGSLSPVKQNPTGAEQQPASPVYAPQHGGPQGAAASQVQHAHWNTTSSPNGPGWSSTASPTFAVELPADLGNLQLSSTKPAQASEGHPSASASEKTQSGMWRLVDAATESPTDEFYALADMLFDALDAKFEPRHTGVLEGPKVLGSGLLKLSDDEKRVFCHESYMAFARMWSVEGIPHMMVPCEATLAPMWNFSRRAHGPRIRVSEGSRASQARYMPALNRAGWYKFLFVEAMRAGEALGEAVAAVGLAGVAGQLDLNKLDRTVDPAVRARAGELRAYAVGQACEETRAAMAGRR